MTNATYGNAQNLTPEVLRNTIVESVDQMERIQVDEEGQYASAMTVFPMLNLNDPDEGYYTYAGTRGPMSPTARASESPMGSLTLPDKENVEVSSYKKKFMPDKGTETSMSNTPFSVFARAASVIRLEIFLTREQVAWRGDDDIDGLVGQHGQTPHPDLPNGHAIEPEASWSDRDNSKVYQDLTHLGHNVINNGRLFGNDALPTVFMSPDAARDMKQSQDMEDRVAGVQVKSIGIDDVAEIVDDEIGDIRRVMVYVPRTNENGEFIDENDNVVTEADEAVQDNILEPYDPDTGETVRHVIVGRPGLNSAYVPWFNDALLEYQEEVPPSGEISIDDQLGFFTQMWTGNDPLGTRFKGGQEIGFELERPENFAILRDV